MRVSVLGLGSIGLRHARNFLTLGHRVLGFDPEAQRRDQFEMEGGITTSDRRQAIENCDAVVVASPNAHHLGDLRDAVSAGRHVQIEKPLAHTDAGIEEILRSADVRGLSVFVAFNLRQHPVIKRVRRMIEDGAIGEAFWARFQMSDYLPHWRPNQDYRAGYAADSKTGGVIFDLAHELDAAWYLMGPGEAHAAVARKTALLEIESEDCADVILRHRDGGQSAIHLDYVSRPRRRVADIQGTVGAIFVDLDQRRFVHRNIDGDIVADERFDGDYADDYVEQAKVFSDVINGRCDNPYSGWEGLDVLRMILAVRRLAGLPEGEELARTGT